MFWKSIFKMTTWITWIGYFHVILIVYLPNPNFEAASLCHSIKTLFKRGRRIDMFRFEHLCKWTKWKKYVLSQFLLLTHPRLVLSIHLLVSSFNPSLLLSFSSQSLLANFLLSIHPSAAVHSLVSLLDPSLISYISQSILEQFLLSIQPCSESPLDPFKLFSS